MFTVRETIDRVFRKIKFDRFNLAIDTRFAVLGIISIYTFGLALFSKISTPLFLVSIFLFLFLSFVNYKLKKHHYLASNTIFLYFFYFFELTILSFGINYFEFYGESQANPLLSLFYSSILISSFHGKTEIVYFTTILSTILKSFLFISDSETNSIQILFHFFLTTSFNLLFGFLVVSLIDSFKRAQIMISSITFKNIFDTSLSNIQFINREEIFFDHILIKSEIDQSDRYGGGDFICVSKTDDWIYGIIGDITGHGTNMITGAYLAGLIFKSTLSTIGKPKTHELLKAINKALHDLDILQGGRGLAIAFRISRTGDFFYSGFIHKNCMKIGDKIALLSKPYSLGTKQDYVVDSEFFFNLKANEVEIVTDGWTSGDDDKARLTIKWL